MLFADEKPATTGGVIDPRCPGCFFGLRHIIKFGNKFAYDSFPRISFRIFVAVIIGLMILYSGPVLYFTYEIISIRIITTRHYFKYSSNNIDKILLLCTHSLMTE